MTDLEQCVRTSPELREAREFLSSFRSRTASAGDGSIGEQLRESKRKAVRANDQTLASAVWCLEQVDGAQRHYIDALECCRERRFYAGWCALEQAEISLHHLARHYRDPDDYMGVELLRDRIPKFQSLFPYRVFFSPGFVIRRAECSICRRRIELRSSCGHERWGLYDGEMCGRILTRVEFMEVSIVERPVQKYSVAFPQGLGSYNYGLVAYALLGLRTIWDDWSVAVQKRRRDVPELSTPEYRSAGRNDPCPCGSGRKLKKCCYARSLEVHDHYQFLFEDPPDGLPSYIPSARMDGLDEGGRKPTNEAPELLW